MFIQGIVATTVHLVYLFPIWGFYWCGGLVFAYGLDADSQGEPFGFLASGLGLFIVVLQLAYLLLAELVFGVGLMRYATTEKLNSFTSIGTNFSIAVKNAGKLFPTFVMLVILAVITMVVIYALFFACCLPFLMFGYLYMVIGYVLGKLAVDIGITKQVEFGEGHFV